MAIHIKEIENNPGAAGLEVDWDDGQFVIIPAKKGMVACGIVDMEAAEKFNFAVAIASGTPEKPLVTADDLLSAKVSKVSSKAADLGIQTGMTGNEALKFLI